LSKNSFYHLLINANPQYLFEGLADLCGYAPEFLKAKCSSTVSEYGEYVIDLLVELLDDPIEICGMFCPKEIKNAINKIKRSIG
jgi:hypothetical protein